MRPSWVEVDLAAISHNAAQIAGAVSPAQLCAVVKADAYGHGDVPVAEAALAGGASHLAVALVEEGIRLREAGIEVPILVLSEPALEDAAEVVAWRLTPTAYRRDYLAALEAAADGPVAVHLKLDTGMHRVGADPAELADLAQAVADSPSLTLGGLWTHFAVGEEDGTFTAGQVAALEAGAAHLAALGIEADGLHAANTAGALYHPASRFDMVRAGIGIYGYLPIPAANGAAAADPLPQQEAAAVRLRPAMRVMSTVTLVRRLPAGARPSYGRRTPLERAANVATVPIGYADGVPRRWGDVGGEVLIGGKRRRFAGTVTMDLIVVDVGADEVRVGDEVVILGSQGGDQITADELAAKLQTISYEILCGFGPRLPRRYLR